jgi:hypothetical protein
MNKNNPARLREELRMLLARYDHGAMPPAIYAVVVKLQREIGWAEQNAVHASRYAETVSDNEQHSV